MFSEVMALQLIASFLPNILPYIEKMTPSKEARLNAEEALDFIFADENSDEEGIIDEKEEFESVSEFLS